jgi:hypothetical protein
LAHYGRTLHFRASVERQPAVIGAIGPVASQDGHHLSDPPVIHRDVGQGGRVTCGGQPETGQPAPVSLLPFGALSPARPLGCPGTTPRRVAVLCKVSRELYCCASDCDGNSSCQSHSRSFGANLNIHRSLRNWPRPSSPPKRYLCKLLQYISVGSRCVRTEIFRRHGAAACARI